jgi:hypothetical protein
MACGERRAGRLVVALATATAAVSGAADAAASVEVLSFRTVPPVAGVRVASAGRTFTTDQRGIVLLPVVRTGRGYRDFVPPRVLPTPLAAGLQARFGGFFDSGRTIGISLYRRTRLHFVDGGGGPVRRGRIEGIHLAAGTGARIALRARATPALQASHVVRTTAGVTSKPIEYAIESVRIEGSNVVDRSRQRFVPLRNPHVRVRLRLFAARFTATDAVFGGPTGTAVVLEYPNGRAVRVRLRDGKAALSGLPRGNYTVRLEARGLTAPRPVALSRDQVVDLKVISYLDVAVVCGTGVALALGLILAGRPLLRRRLYRVVRPRAGPAQ